MFGFLSLMNASHPLFGFKQRQIRINRTLRHLLWTKTPTELLYIVLKKKKCFTASITILFPMKAIHTKPYTLIQRSSCSMKLFTFVFPPSHAYVAQSTERRHTFVVDLVCKTLASLTSTITPSSVMMLWMIFSRSFA
jgi:hypothetical protein